MSARARAAAGLVVTLVVLAALVALLLGRSDDDPPRRRATAEPSAPASTEQGTVLRPTGRCATPAARPFVPTRISVPGVVPGADVVAVPRDDRGVTGVLPLSEKTRFAWDLGGIEPGERRGNVLLNTHTWPDGSALGNALLDGLDLGDRVVLSGEGRTLCYRVTQRIQVRAADGYPPYYDADGPPRVAIIVCSGRRTGPGQWTHRTIWFARPTTRTTG